MPKYVAGLCVMTEAGSLGAPYDSEEFEAGTDEHAIRKARVWVTTSGRMFSEETWLQVLLDGRSIHSEKVEPQFAPRS
jgi:hypothetical protein